MILQRYLARIACIKKYLQECYKNGVILQVQKNLASFLKESCKETSDLLNRHFLQEKWTNQKSLARIFQDLAFLAPFARLLHFSATILHYLARSCKKHARILQVLSDSLTRECQQTSYFCAKFPLFCNQLSCHVHKLFLFRTFKASVLKLISRLTPNFDLIFFTSSLKVSYLIVFDNFGLD